MDEERLIKRAQNGDCRAFETLVEIHFKNIYNIALKMAGNTEDASDMTQEIMIKLFRNIGSFSGNSKFSTWVYRVATNTCLDELKKIKRHTTYSLDAEIDTGDGEVRSEISDDSPTPDKVAEQRELSNTIAEAIKLLSADHRAAIVLRDIRGFSYDETAKILGCTQGTVKSRISRARAQLKKILEKDFGFSGTYSKD